MSDRTLALSARKEGRKKGPLCMPYSGSLVAYVLPTVTTYFPCFAYLLFIVFSSFGRRGKTIPILYWPLHFENEARAASNIARIWLSITRMAKE